MPRVGGITCLSVQLWLTLVGSLGLWQVNQASLLRFTNPSIRAGNPNLVLTLAMALVVSITQRICASKAKKAITLSQARL
jgi:hypothetical protein